MVRFKFPMFRMLDGKIIQFKFPVYLDGMNVQFKLPMYLDGMNV